MTFIINNSPPLDTDYECVVTGLLSVYWSLQDIIFWRFSLCHVYRLSLYTALTSFIGYDGWLKIRNRLDTELIDFIGILQNANITMGSIYNDGKGITQMYLGTCYHWSHVCSIHKDNWICTEIYNHVQISARHHTWVPRKDRHWAHEWYIMQICVFQLVYTSVYEQELQGRQKVIYSFNCRAFVSPE